MLSRTGRDYSRIGAVAGVVLQPGHARSGAQQVPVPLFPPFVQQPGAGLFGIFGVVFLVAELLGSGVFAGGFTGSGAAASAD